MQQRQDILKLRGFRAASAGGLCKPQQPPLWARHSSPHLSSSSTNTTVFHLEFLSLMRLLNARSKKVHFFVDREIPSYAILSHTWGAGEVTFQDIQRPWLARLKAGWKKIDFASRQAILDNLDWVWIDTCCIDKSSSAELSEAINSMFAWYHESATCYAFLSDVQAEPEADADDVRPALLSSRWFTRGWTLQELIAPDEVLFFNAKWSFLGTRRALSSLIAEITAIDLHILDFGWYVPQTEEFYMVYDQRHRELEKVLEQYSVAQKMSWAASRTTTRIEDQAYCLLGLFSINMPLLYGERDRAFARLQHSIVATSHDSTILAWGLEEEDVTYGYYSRFDQTHRPDILAPSPRYFSRCENVVQTSRPGRSLHEPLYTFTPSGLKFRAWVMELPENVAFILLDCQYRDSNHGNSGPLALKVNEARRTTVDILDCCIPPDSNPRIRPFDRTEIKNAVCLEINLRSSSKESTRQLPDSLPRIRVRSLSHPTLSAKDVRMLAAPISAYGIEPVVFEIQKKKRYAVKLLWPHETQHHSFALSIREVELPISDSSVSAAYRDPMRPDQWQLRDFRPLSVEQAFPEAEMLIAVKAEAVNEHGTDAVALDVEIKRTTEGLNSIPDSDDEDDDTVVVDPLVTEDLDETLYNESGLPKDGDSSSSMVLKARLCI